MCYHSDFQPLCREFLKHAVPDYLVRDADLFFPLDCQIKK